MFDTSKDILFVVISFCIVWLTVFLCWAMYQFGKVLKNANEVVEEFRMRIDALTSAIDFVRGRIEQMSGLMNLAGQGLSGYVKKYASNKMEKMFSDTTEKMDDATRAAVKKAVAETAKKMKKVAKKIKK